MQEEILAHLREVGVAKTLHTFWRVIVDLGPAIVTLQIGSGCGGRCSRGGQNGSGRLLRRKLVMVNIASREQEYGQENQIAFHFWCFLHFGR